MPEPSKIIEGGIEVLRRFPLAIRIVALICLLVPSVIFLYAHFNWPYWPVHNSLWLNVIGLVFSVLALVILVSYSPRPRVSVAELPETKPVFAESLKYFKEGPELEGRRAQLVKGMQADYETSASPNRYELSPEQMKACITSDWEFDRIAGYLFERYKSKPAGDERIKRVRHEVRLLATRSWKGTLVPLHYAVESVFPGLLDADGSVPQISEEQLEPFRDILKGLNTVTARLLAPFTGLRGRKIIGNCRMLLDSGRRSGQDRRSQRPKGREKELQKRANERH